MPKPDTTGTKDNLLKKSCAATFSNKHQYKWAILIIVLALLISPSPIQADEKVDSIRIGFLPVKMAKFSRNLKSLELAQPEDYYLPFMRECMSMLQNNIMQIKGIKLLERKELNTLDAERIFKLSDYSEAVYCKAGESADYLVLPESAYFKGKLYIRLNIFKTSDSSMTKPLFEVEFRSPKKFVKAAYDNLFKVLSGNTETSGNNRSETGKNNKRKIVAVIPCSTTGSKYDMSDIVSEVSCCIFSGSQAFKLVDRTRVMRCIEELKLSETGLVDKKSSLKIGNMLGADLIVLPALRKGY